MAFPTTGILDNFNRSNENPLSDAGSWDYPIGATKVIGFNSFKLVSNAIMDDSAADGGGSASAFWDAANFGPGAEVYVTITTLWQASGSDFWFWLNGAQEQGETTHDGFPVYLAWSSGTTWNYTFYRADNGTWTQLGAGGTVTVVSGDSLGFEHASSTLTLYRKTGGSWSSVTTRSDNTYTSGHIGLSKGFADTTSVLDDFGGGTIVAGGSGVPRRMYQYRLRRS